MVGGVKVSILVLLDFVLKEIMGNGGGEKSWRFNPCFIGFCS